MATPKGAIIGAVQSINISSNAKASPRNKAIGNIDSVQFTNNDPTNTATVTFLGAGANVFGASSVSVPPNGGTSSHLTPNQSNLTVDYIVAAGSATGGPNSIEVGSGPLEIDVIDSNGDTNLGTAEIPNNGTLFFNNQTGYPGTVTFGDSNTLFDSSGNGVSSQPLAANSAAPTLTGKGTNKHVSYSVHLNTGERHRVGDGSGSIKVGSN